MRGAKVEGAGPFDAPIWWVGEAPGRTEERLGEPFVGMTGEFVQRALEVAGVDWARDVRRNNAIPICIEMPTAASARKGVVRKWWDWLEEECNTVTPRVVVACGAAALDRLRHLVTDPVMRPGSSILEESGMVYPITEGRMRGALFIPIRHPAGVMRSKLQAHRPALIRVAARVAEYGVGGKRYRRPRPNVVLNPEAKRLAAWLDGVKAVAVDTEFDKGARRLDSIQLACNTSEVVVVDAMTRDRLEVIRGVLEDPGVLKAAHYHTADADSLGWMGIDVAVGWFDTLATFSRLYPDLDMGLDDVSAFYCDNAWGWKRLETMDLEYRALDAHFGWRVFVAVKEDLEEADARVGRAVYEETMPLLPLLWGMEERGWDIDKGRQREINGRLDVQAEEIRERVVARATAVFDARIDGARREMEAAGAEVAGIYTDAFVRLGMTCSEHPGYQGTKLKKFKTNGTCRCREIADGMKEAREQAKGVTKAKKSTAQSKVKRWSSTGFNPGNNEHVRWMLYDKQALGLPVQKDRETGKPTADKDAIAKLLTLASVEKKPGAREMLKDIKLYQHLEKFKSTFVNPAVDDEGRAHPPMRAHGAGTGRIASGDDDALADKSASEFAFNALNMPDKVRQIVVAGEV